MDRELFGKAHFVYVMTEEGEEFSKVGISSNPKYRLESIQQGNPRKVALVETWAFEQRATARRIEGLVLESLADFRVPGKEWCACTPDEIVSVVVQVLRLQMQTSNET